MGLNGCCSVIKYLVILVNLIFWIVGLAIVVLSIWMLTDPTFLISMTQDENHYYIGLYILFAVGALMVTVAFLGCCGAFKESQCMLVSFFCCLLIVLVAEVAAGSWTYHNRDKLDDIVRAAVKNSVQEEYGVVSSRTIAFDSIQKYYECCGADGPNDWASSKYNNVDKSNFLDATLGKLNPIYNIPESCCKEQTEKLICETVRKTGITASINPAINRQGCMEKLIDEIKNNLKTIYAVGLCIAGVEILALILSLILCCAIRRNDNYKA
uniref:Tetraspanin n=1 Tax=Corethrella appendiculata TaxID=1370023 RepID=U5EXL7_9DIPT